MEKKKFNFKKFGLVLCVCFITLFAFIPFANFNRIGFVSASTITDTQNDLQLNTSIDLNTWSLISMFDANGSTFVPSASAVWTDGDNLYYSSSTTQLVFNQFTSSWSAKTWTGLTSFSGSNVWSDGENVYYSSGSSQYILDKLTSTWTKKTWTGLTSFSGSYIWSYKGNVYFSNGYAKGNSAKQYVLDKSTSTWTKFVWTGDSLGTYTNVYGNSFWTDGTNLYYSNNTLQFEVDIDTYTLIDKTWLRYDGLTFNITGSDIWTDGINIYASCGSSGNFILDPSTDTWYAKSWNGDPVFNGFNIFIFKGVYYCYFSSAIYFIPYGYYNAGYSTGYEMGYSDGYVAGYEAGLNSAGSSDSSLAYNQGYQNGYNAGVATNSGYSNGYDTGYNAGYHAGLSTGTNSGYKDGYDTGLTEGYNNGYNVGVNDSNQYTFYNLFGAVLDAPVRVFSDLFNFNLLGINLLGLITGLLTLAMVILVLKLIFGGK